MNKETINFIVGLMVTLFIAFSIVTIPTQHFYHKSKINKYKKEISELQSIIENKYKFRDTTITAYSPCVTETDNTPNETAIMETPIPGWSCAVSRDLNFLLGKKIYIVGLGVFHVNDLMNKRFKNRVDICMSKNNAIAFGVKIRDVVMLDYR